MNMIEINKTTLGIAAGVAGTLFLGYSIYFDKKRRSDPEYKKKVHERRRRQRQNETTNRGTLPDLSDHEAIERYFLQEIQLGESFIGRGDFETGVEHLANAIVVCGQPARLLQVLQSSLPPQVFGMLVLRMRDMQNIAEANDKGPTIVAANSSLSEAAKVFEGGSNAVIIDDVE